MKTLRKSLPALIGILLVLLAWQAACGAGLFSSYVLPPPAKVAQALLRMAASGELLRDVRISFARVLRGFSIAFVFAFALGSLRCLLPESERFYAPVIHFFRHVPPISLIPLLILWCGIGETTKTVIIVLAAFPPLYLSVVKGFTSCSPLLLDAAHSLSCTKTRAFLRVILPLALPDLLVGMRAGLGYAWRAIIGAEMVAASTGLGHLILFAQQMSRTDRVIAGILVIGAAGSLTDFILARLIARLAPASAVHEPEVH
ncbi:MAG: ABC transporter permease [Clostridia bacterium]|nr:ABC transporter permease [Clostridia bacterium]